MALSSSMFTEVTHYGRTRLLRWRILALWLLLVGATMLCGATLLTPNAVAAQAVFQGVAVATFRLWDDLADRVHDRLRHPSRILVTGDHSRAFVVLAAAGLVLLALMLRNDLPRLAVYLLLVSSISVLYHSNAAQGLARSLRAGFVLAKYPVFIFLVAPHSLRAWFVSLGVFAVLVVYEWRSEPEFRDGQALPFVAAALAGAALVSALYISAGVW